MRIQHNCLTWVFDISWASHNEQPSKQTRDLSGLLRTCEPTSGLGSGSDSSSDSDSGFDFVRRKVSNVRGWPSIATGFHLRFRPRLGFRLGWSWFHTMDLHSKKSKLSIFLLSIIIINCKYALCDHFWTIINRMIRISEWTEYKNKQIKKILLNIMLKRLFWNCICQFDPVIRLVT